MSAPVAPSFDEYGDALRILAESASGSAAWTEGDVTTARETADEFEAALTAALARVFSAEQMRVHGASLRTAALVGARLSLGGSNE